MIWLYLFVLLVAIVGLGLIVVDWARGIRRGSLMPFAVLVLSAYIAVTALTWIHELDPTALPQLPGQAVAGTGDRVAEIRDAGSDRGAGTSGETSRWTRAESLSAAQLAVSAAGVVLTVVLSRRRVERAHRRDRPAKASA